MKVILKYFVAATFALIVWINPASAQSPSEFALIRRPVLRGPQILKLTKSVTNELWGIDLFANPRSSAESYVAAPWYELYTGVKFTLDTDWDRIVYKEGLDNWIRRYSSNGQGDCQVWWPRSIETLSPCNAQYFTAYYFVYVADTENNRLVRFVYDWRPANQWVVCLTPITGLGLNRPAELNLNDGGTFYTFTEDNYLWVVNAPNGIPYEIKRITVDGVLKSTYSSYGCNGTPGDFCKISAIVSGRDAFAPNAYSNTDDFYVADPGNGRVVWLRKDAVGETIFWMGEVPAGSGSIDLEVDHFGHLWVLDRDAGTVTKYTSDLFPLCTFGSTGVGENEFMMPVSISDPVGYLGASNMYIVEDWSDSSGGQYYAIGTDVVDFTVTSSFEEHIHYVDFVLVSPSKVTINVYTVQGALVKTLFQDPLLSGASTSIWDGKNSAGQQMPTAVYLVKIFDSSTVIDPATGDPINVVTKEAWVHHEFNCCNTDGVRGDVDNICSASCINILDLDYLIAFIFEGGPAPPCTTEGNVDGVGFIGILDITYLIDFIFRGGPLPPACP